jgi:hypothetical protein
MPKKEDSDLEISIEDLIRFYKVERMADFYIG